MKRILFVVAALALAFSALPALGATGNGAPSGPHYNLNIIGTGDKSADMTGNNGHRIFVPLYGRSAIYLFESPEQGYYAVLDANGTDGPSSCCRTPIMRTMASRSTRSMPALGKPGGNATMQTCATDPTTGEEVCSMDLDGTDILVNLSRTNGKQSFDNVSRELLYIYADLDGDGTLERYPLFDDRLEDFFWEYGNNGLRIAQLHFYQVSTDVTLEE